MNIYIRSIRTDDSHYKKLSEVINYLEKRNFKKGTVSKNLRKGKVLRYKHLTFEYIERSRLNK